MKHITKLLNYITKLLKTLSKTSLTVRPSDIKHTSLFLTGVYIITFVSCSISMYTLCDFLNLVE